MSDVSVLQWLDDHSDLILSYLDSHLPEGYKTIYCCAAGSRLYGLDTDKSDYDYRFIFTSPLSLYHSISTLSKGIQPNQFDFSFRFMEVDGKEIPISPTSVPSSSTYTFDDSGYYPTSIYRSSKKVDLVGYDISKFFSLCSAGNIDFLSLLNSPILVKPNDQLSVLSQCFKPYKAFLHYLNYFHLSSLSLYPFHFFDDSFYLLASSKHPINIVSNKFLITSLRTLMSAKFILTYKSIPPFDIVDLAQAVFDDSSICASILDFRDSMRANFVSMDFCCPTNKASSVQFLTYIKSFSVISALILSLHTQLSDFDPEQFFYLRDYPDGYSCKPDFDKINAIFSSFIV